ncbi:Uncharacterized protein conserved in bacteria [Neisseria meningitidis]|nr:Uncharacterized protein conserved in bacteria [Neisseria meningitidis]
MAILKLDEHLYISPQLTKADAEQIAQLGIKTVICNRPDREEESQPDFAQIKQWLEQAGVTGFHHQPVTARDIQKHDVETFRQLIGQAESPVLAYCGPVRAAPSCGASAGRQKVCRLTKSSAAPKRQA